MSTTTLPVHTAAGLLGFALARRNLQRPRQEHTVCWWTPNGFGLPSCQLHAGFSADVGFRCCMKTLGASSPAGAGSEDGNT
jgi:hypothetical protein